MIFVSVLGYVAAALVVAFVLGLLDFDSIEAGAIGASWPITLPIVVLWMLCHYVAEFAQRLTRRN